ncbi:MAG: Type III restriction enzyme, res subunit [Chloroflexi bacterium ADurb.Bin360]|nr:MAG: Type III restriction enzyme, res subunit [Chloroflexi bacterium ADurb.Bin360]
MSRVSLPLSPFAMLRFQHPFRKYQRMILEQVASGQGDHRYHLVAPPGAGKTIVGLELLRRFDAPAVVFAPTTTIQEQWRAKAALFLPEDASPEALDALVSLDPHVLAPVNVFTYQLLSTPGESQAWVETLARERWLRDLLEEGRAPSEEAAMQRLALLQRNNLQGYRRELARRYQRFKHELLQGEPSAVAPFLHQNARALIERLLAYGVRTVVLDECHHLLDYWAVVLRYFISQIPDCRVIGLTATLPSLEDGASYDNYTALLGEVDFEVPTPAVVKEGDLAPYRDLVYFVEPSPRERDYLKNIQSAFEGAIAELTHSAAFRAWIANLVFAPQGKGGQSLPWEELLRRRPVFAVACLRFLRQRDFPLPEGFPLPQEAESPLTLDDWVALLERYGLDELALSPEPADHLLLRRLRKILQPFGFTLTERGLRHQRSPGDLILTFSESKDEAVLRILTAESEALGTALRAVVVTDFERLSSGVRRARGILDQDAGSAVRVFRRLAHDERFMHEPVRALAPVLVTGRLLLVDVVHGPAVVAALQALLQAEGLRATCRAEPTEFVSELQVVGEGPDWGSRTYVRLVTRLLEQGITRCIIGTRGIFGEGWDSLTLNTLIDLTSVTTSTSVQQLRGRSIRLDPRWPHKVAHNWDVVCVAPTYEKGGLDLSRFVRRHAQYWGVVPESRLQALVNDAGALLSGEGGLPADGRGRIVKGVGHVDPDLAYQLATRPLKQITFAQFTQRMLQQIPRRERTYALWGIGEEYSNFAYRATRLDTRDLKIRTVFTVQNTLKRMLRMFAASIVGGILVIAWVFLQLALGSDGSDAACLAPLLALVLGTFFVFALNLRSAYRLGKALLVEQPPDGILRDIAQALLAALKDAGVLSRHLQPDYVRVVEQPDNSYEVLLDYASPEDAAAFIEAYQQLFEPVVDQRYLILRDDSSLPSLPLRVVWSRLRRLFRDAGLYQAAYHPVPKVLATRRELAEALARYWQRYVGGGELVYTRSEEGRRILLKARSQKRPKAKGLAFEVWR